MSWEVECEACGLSESAGWSTGPEPTDRFWFSVPAPEAHERPWSADADVSPTPSTKTSAFSSDFHSLSDDCVMRFEICVGREDRHEWMDERANQDANKRKQVSRTETHGESDGASHRERERANEINLR